MLTMSVTATKPAWEVSLELPMPPSVNKAYVSLNNRRILSKEGKLYKQSVRDIIGQAYGTTPVPSMENTPLTLKVVLVFDAIENKGWSKGTAKSRYKRVDVSNRVKLLEDAMFEVLGVDDSLIFSLYVTKRVGSTSAALVTLTPYMEDR